MKNLNTLLWCVYIYTYICTHTLYNICTWFFILLLYVYYYTYNSKIVLYHNIIYICNNGKAENSNTNVVSLYIIIYIILCIICIVLIIIYIILYYMLL